MIAPPPNQILTGDCLETMRSWPDSCIDHCIAAAHDRRWLLIDSGPEYAELALPGKA